MLEDRSHLISSMTCLEVLKNYFIVIGSFITVRRWYKISDAEVTWLQFCCRCPSICLSDLTASVVLLTVFLSIIPSYKLPIGPVFTHWDFKYALSSMGTWYYEMCIRWKTDLAYMIDNKVNTTILFTREMKIIKGKFIYFN